MISQSPMGKSCNTTTIRINTHLGYRRAPRAAGRRPLRRSNRSHFPRIRANPSAPKLCRVGRPRWTAASNASKPCRERRSDPCRRSNQRCNARLAIARGWPASRRTSSLPPGVTGFRRSTKISRAESSSSKSSLARAAPASASRPAASDQAGITEFRIRLRK